MGVSGVVLEVVRERHAVLRRALEQLDFGSAQVIDPPLVAYVLSFSSLRQRESVYTVAVDLASRSWRDVVA